MLTLRNVLLSGLLSLCLAGGYLEANEFDDFALQLKEEFNSFKQDSNTEYDNYRKQYREELIAFKNEISEQWGYAEVSTKNKAVIYSEDQQEKLIIDFDSQELIVEQTPRSKRNSEQMANWVERKLLEPLSYTNYRTADDDKQTIKKETSLPPVTLASSLALPNKDVPQLAKKVIDSKQSRERDSAIKETIENLDTENKLLQNHLESTVSTNVDEQNKEDKTEQIKEKQEIILSIEDRKKEQQEYKLVLDKLKSNPSDKQVLSHKINIKNNRWERSASYRQPISSAAQATQLPEPLIYAIMETESSFNPVAVSPIPAFGLMQIVPYSAGIDVNQHLYKNKSAPSKELLFNPEKNVTFGSTYLHILYYRYLAGIKDPQSRLYCTIAAYNTGAGNVAKTFNGSSMKIKDATVKINKLSPEQVYNALFKKLPYDETRRYLKKVSEAIDFYNKQVNPA